MKYNKNYITLFIIKLDLENDLDKEAFTSFSEDIKKEFGAEFPQSRESILNENEINVSETKVSTELRQSQQLQLISVDQQAQITLNKNSVFIEYKKYNTYLEARKKIEIVNSLLTKHVGTLNYKRIGMRYINNINLPAKNIRDCFNWKGYVNDKLNASIKLIDSNEVIRQIEVIELMLNEFNLRMRIQAGLPNRAYPAKITSKEYLLDLDCYGNYMIKDNEILEILDVLHQKNICKFEWLIGDKLRGLMNE